VVLESFWLTPTLESFRKVGKVYRQPAHEWVHILGPVWVVANYATLCLRLVIRIEELTLYTKVRQIVAS
jgi:hypothetical protein